MNEAPRSRARRWNCARCRWSPLLLLVAACSPPTTIDPDDLSVLLSSGRADGIAFVFQVRGELACAGADVNGNGDSFELTFVPRRDGVDVDLPAEPFEHPEHGACQVVHHRVAGGGQPGRQLTYRIAGMPGSKWTVTATGDAQPTQDGPR